MAGKFFLFLLLLLLLEVLNNAISDSQIDEPQCGCPKRVELLVVSINMGVQSINSESFFNEIPHHNSPLEVLEFPA